MYNVIQDTYLFTATCNSWIQLLTADENKTIILETLSRYSKDYSLHFHAFVIMPNHVHFVIGGAEDSLLYFRQSFTRISAHRMLKYLRSEQPDLLETVLSTQNDRRYHIWERRSHWLRIRHDKMMRNVIRYVHNNPLQRHWQLCELPEEYPYSSAKSYATGNAEFDFLTLWGLT
ncbi:MAG: transposase [Bacteroidetes bacterium]|nr:transposase [Bacteroidota bacterium]